MLQYILNDDRCADILSEAKIFRPSKIDSEVNPITRVQEISYALNDALNLLANCFSMAMPAPAYTSLQQ